MYFASFNNNFAVISLLIILTLKGYPCIPKLTHNELVYDDDGNSLSTVGDKIYILVC